MPKKKKQSRKTTQYQRQSVTVNIGTATKRKRKGGGGGGGGHRQNLAPTFITAPQVDFTPLLAMLTHQTRSLQPEPFQNPVTPLSSVTQVLPAEQMAGEAAIRRAGPTAGSFEPVSHMEREISATTQAREALSEILKAQGGRRSRSSSPSPSVASTRVALPEGRASISTIKEMGAAEERGRIQREKMLRGEQLGAFNFLTNKAKQAKIGLFNTELEGKPLEGKKALSEQQKTLYRQGISRSGINLTELSGKAQQRTRREREKKPATSPAKQGRTI